MTTAPQVLPEDPDDRQIEQIQRDLRKVERRDWWLWVTAVVIMLLLTAAVVALSFPELMRPENTVEQTTLVRAVRGLVLLVLLFNTYSIYQQFLIKRLRRQLSTQLNLMDQLRVRTQEFRRLATTDPLTGLYNRRFAEQRLAAETARSQRYGHPLTLIALDLNQFKEINDQHGHAAGDLVLKEFAARLGRVIRASDLAVRIGGDEFLILLPECPSAQAQTLLKRLGPLEVDYRGRKIPVTFSAGYAGYQRGETPEQFLDRADRALYANKRTRA